MKKSSSVPAIKKTLVLRRETTNVLRVRTDVKTGVFSKPHNPEGGGGIQPSAVQEVSMWANKPE